MAGPSECATAEESNTSRSWAKMKRYLLALLFVLGAVPAQAGIPAEKDSCLDCHTDESMTFDLPGGEKLTLAVDKEKFAKSVHGEMLRCTDCHSDKKDDHADGEITIGGTPGVPAKTKRELTLASYEQ